VTLTPHCHITQWAERVSMAPRFTPLDRHYECKEHHVCIIGAGPVGLAAAGELEQKAVIFDREDEVGGKCQAW
jgi:NADPH-dependent glutamate synthase beta subunit-like oxidoreductase